MSVPQFLHRKTLMFLGRRILLINERGGRHTTLSSTAFIWTFLTRAPLNNFNDYMTELSYRPCALLRGNSLRNALWIFCTRQNVIVLPLFHVKMPEFFGVSQDLAT